MKRLLVLALLLTTTSCELAQESEKVTCEVISPSHSVYVEADPNLSDLEKARRHRLVNSWRVRNGFAALPKTPSEERAAIILAPTEGAK